MVPTRMSNEVTPEAIAAGLEQAVVTHVRLERKEFVKMLAVLVGMTGVVLGILAPLMLYVFVTVNDHQMDMAAVNAAIAAEAFSGVRHEAVADQREVSAEKTRVAISENLKQQAQALKALHDNQIRLMAVQHIPKRRHSTLPAGMSIGTE